MESYRKFQAGPDPFGRVWDAEYQWQQTAISIRHSDSVDVKFNIWTEGEPKQERVVALMLPDLMAVCEEIGHPLTDAYCMKLAGMHLRRMIETFEDMEKTLVTAKRVELDAYAEALAPRPGPVMR